MIHGDFPSVGGLASSQSFARILRSHNGWGANDRIRVRRKVRDRGARSRKREIAR